MRYRSLAYSACTALNDATESMAIHSVHDRVFFVNELLRALIAIGIPSPSPGDMKAAYVHVRITISVWKYRNTYLVCRQNVRTLRLRVFIGTMLNHHHSSLVRCE